MVRAHQHRAGRTRFSFRGRRQRSGSFARQLVERAKTDGVSLVGPGGLLAGITRTVLGSALDAELDAHLDDAGVDEATGRRVNIRNGHGAKTVRTEVSWWRGMGAGEPGSESAGPRLPPENSCQELTNSDQEEQVFDRVDAAQGLLATSDGMPGVTTVGNKGSSVRIRLSRQK